MTKYKSREIIFVLGRTGQGKSIWTRIFMQDKKRVFASDLLKDFRCTYIDEKELLNMHDDGLFASPNKFRVGISNPDELEAVGCLAFIHGQAWLMIEEAGFYFASGAKAPVWMRNAAFLGRHQELNIIITAQRPTSIPIDMRSQASRVICFSQREKNDVAWLGSYFGDYMDAIPDLQELECLDATSSEIVRYKINPEDDDKIEHIEEEDSDLSSFQDLGYK
jgi:hypothetical protein